MEALLDALKPCPTTGPPLAAALRSANLANTGVPELITAVIKELGGGQQAPPAGGEGAQQRVCLADALCTIDGLAFLTPRWGAEGGAECPRCCCTATRRRRRHSLPPAAARLAFAAQGQAAAGALCRPLRGQDHQGRPDGALRGHQARGGAPCGLLDAGTLARRCLAAPRLPAVGAGSGRDAVCALLPCLLSLPADHRQHPRGHQGQGAAVHPHRQVGAALGREGRSHGQLLPAVADLCGAGCDDVTTVPSKW